MERNILTGEALKEMQELFKDNKKEPSIDSYKIRELLGEPLPREEKPKRGSNYTKPKKKR